MNGALIVSLFLETLGLTPPPISCAFPGVEPGQKAITLQVEPMPSLKDGFEGFRVRMEFDKALTMMAAAAPITTTDERDVMIRGKTEDFTFYTLGLREDGAAALNLMWTRPKDQPARQHTRTGACENHESYIRKWLTS